MSTTGRDTGSKGSTDAFDKLFGDGPPPKPRTAKNGANAKNGHASNAKNGFSSKNGASKNGANGTNGARSRNGADIADVVDDVELDVVDVDVEDLELDVADLELDVVDDLDVTGPRDPDTARSETAELDDIEADEVDVAELIDGDDDTAGHGDATDEHPILPRDATGEYVLPDTVPVEPHDLDDDEDADDAQADGEGDDTVEVSTIVAAATTVDDVDTLDDEAVDTDGELKIVVRSDDEDFIGDDIGDDVADHILEELRRADIDGPVVPMAPQDESTSMRRRPRRAADYDPAPVPIPARVPRVLGRKPRVRKVTRVVRHVDPWSVFKVALVANMVLYIIVLTASVLLWNVANTTGTVQNVERFFESFGWNSFEFNGGELYHAGWVAGLFVVVGLTGLAVLAATLFNLITDLVGGVRFTVLEEEVVETRTSPMRRFVVRRTEPEIPAVVNDASGVMIREAVVDDTGANVRPTR